VERFDSFFQLRGFMNEVLLDQIPSLIDLQRYLEQLSIMEPPAMKKDIILEQVNDRCLFKSLKGCLGQIWGGGGGVRGGSVEPLNYKK